MQILNPQRIILGRQHGVILHLFWGACCFLFPCVEVGSGRSNATAPIRWGRREEPYRYIWLSRAVWIMWSCSCVLASQWDPIRRPNTKKCRQRSSKIILAVPPHIFARCLLTWLMSTIVEGVCFFEKPCLLIPIDLSTSLVLQTPP